MKAFFEKWAPRGSASIQTSAIALLNAAGIYHQWQLSAAPEEVIKHILKPDQHSLELVFVSHVIRASSRTSEENGQLATQISKSSKTVRRRRRRSDNDDCGSSDSEFDVKDFNASKRLQPYGLGDVAHEHLVPFKDLEYLVKGVHRARKSSKTFLVSGPIHKNTPQWMDEKHKCTKTSDLTHAQWTGPEP